jgi:dihydropteroate synthase
MGAEQQKIERLWRCRDRALNPDKRPLLMGILNVTPDSFSDGGRYFDAVPAIARGLAMAEEGADIIDVGGESTRPGAPEVDAEDESSRVIPVIEELARRNGLTVSVDTMKAVVAEKALSAGAAIINDVSALTHDPAMTGVAKEWGAGVILMHMRGTPRTMQIDPQYDDVVLEVCSYLKERVDEAVEQGLDRSTLAVDPGIGFGKSVDHNLELLANLARLRSGGVPIVVGLSRKSFLGKLTGRDVDERLAGSLAAMSYCLMNGADVMRVHDVGEAVDALKVVTELIKKRTRHGAVEQD